MKHCISLILFLSMLCALYGRMDGWYMHDVTRTVKTKHLPWLQNTPAKPVKILYFTGMDASELVELAQRLNIDYNAYVGHFGSTSHEESVVVGTTAVECAQRLAKVMEGDYELFVFYGTGFNTVPSKTRYEILDRVRSGKSNLLLVNPAMLTLPLKKVFENKVAAPEFLCQYSDAEVLPKDIAKDKLKDMQTLLVKENGNLSKDVFTCYELGKGRVATLQFKNAGKITPDYQAQLENRMASFMQAVLWTSKRASDLSFIVPTLENNPASDLGKQGIQLYMSGKDLANVNGEVRIRNEFNEIEATLPLGGQHGFRFTLPRLPQGKYYADIFLRKGDQVAAFGVYRFHMLSPLGSVTLHTGDICEKGQNPKGTVWFQKKQDEPMTLRLRMKDLPHGQVWAKREIPVEAGKNKVEFDFDNCRNRTLAGTLIAELVNGKGEIMGRVTKNIVFPNRTPGDYFIFSWGAPRGVAEALQLEEVFGFSATTDVATELNFRGIPTNIGHLSLGAHKDAKGLTDIGWGGSMKYEDNIYNPAVQEKIREQTKKFMQDNQYAKRSVMIYNLGDENGYNAEAGHGPNDVLYLRKMLQEKYRTIEQLNKQWNSAYKSFDEIPNADQKELLKQGKYAQWNDHYEYIEKSYADWSNFRAAEIKKYDRFAKVGAEGSNPGDLERTIEKLEFWGPYGDSEECRSFRGNRIFTSWYGYHGERSNPNGYPYITQSLLLGVGTGMGWFTCAYPGGSFSILSADLRPSYGPQFVEMLNHLRFGLGQVFAALPFPKSEILVYHSHLSSRAPSVGRMCPAPSDLKGTLFSFFYKHGISFDMVSDRTLSRLNEAKLVFLPGTSVLGTKAANELTAFVKRGGMLVSDMNPGMFNEYFRKMEKNQAPELFGENLTLDNAKPVKLSPVAIDTSLNGEPIRFKARVGMVNPDTTLFDVREVGKGKVILLNFSLSTAASAADPSTPLDAFLLSLFKAAGQKPVYEIAMNGEGYTARPRQGKDFELLGINGFTKFVEESTTGTIRLPAKKFVYKCKAGFVGETDLVPVAFNVKNPTRPLDKAPLQAFAFFDKAQTVPAFQVADRVARGNSAVFDFSAIPEGRFLWIKVVLPDGTEIMRRGQVLMPSRDCKDGKFEFPFAYDDPAGVWTFTVQDVVTGLAKEVKLRVD